MTSTIAVEVNFRINYTFYQYSCILTHFYLEELDSLSLGLKNSDVRWFLSKGRSRVYLNELSLFIYR